MVRIQFPPAESHMRTGPYIATYAAPACAAVRCARFSTMLGISAGGGSTIASKRCSHNETLTFFGLIAVSVINPMQPFMGVGRTSDKGVTIWFR